MTNLERAKNGERLKVRKSGDYIIRGIDGEDYVPSQNYTDDLINWVNQQIDIAVTHAIDETEEPELKTNLLPCPFCGSKAQMIWDKSYDPPDAGGERTPEWDEWYVQCTGCNVVPNGWGNTGWGNENDAIAAWNRRAINNHYEPAVALKEIANWPDGGIRYGQSKIKAFASKALSKFCDPETASPDQIELGKLAVFGKSVWDWIKSNPDFYGDEFSETFLPMAEESGLCRKEPYDPEKHGEIEYGEVGFDIWTWD